MFLIVPLESAILIKNINYTRIFYKQNINSKNWCFFFKFLMIIKERKKRKNLGLFFCRLTEGKGGREWREGTTFRDIQGDR